MNMLRLSWANLKADSLSTALSIMLLAIGVGMVSFVLVISQQLNDRFSRDIRGIDMVVGAKGSPLQLILSAVYQIDNPTGNIPLSEAQRLQKHPLVKYSIPLAYGDSYSGYRIVGTEEKYLKHYDASFAEGAVWTSDFDAVIGSTAAQQLKLSMGAHFHGTHGLEQEGQTHEEMEYHVVGILKPTGTVIDRLILTNISSVWHIHGDHSEPAEEHAHHDHDTAHHHELEEDNREITALLVKFKNPMGMMQLPRHINTNTTMQAALPAIEVNRLYELLGVGYTTLQIIGGIIMCIAAISVFISLLNSLKNRKYELALMRSLGASPFKLFSMIMLESLLICIMGYAAGIALGRIGQLLMQRIGDESVQMGSSLLAFTSHELYLFPITLLIGVIAALIPAFQAYRTDISKVLRNE
jgi:putative ABC transport system permease protein